MEWQHRLSMGKNTLLQRAERHEKRVLAVLFFIMLLIAVLTVGRRSAGGTEDSGFQHQGLRADACGRRERMVSELPGVH